MKKKPQTIATNFRIGRAIHGLRKARNLTIRQLADKAEASAGNLSRMERGDYGITVSTFCRLAAALDTDPGELLSAAFKLPEPTTA